jgi:DNA-binding MarR family transcriptional regulator
MNVGEIRAFRKALRVLEREIGYSLSTETGCCGVSLAQCHLLLESEGQRDANVGELAAALELDKSTLSRTVESLRKAGLLARESDPANRRKALVSLTVEGARKVEEINRLCDVSYAGVLERVPDEKRPAVIEAVALLSDAMREARRERQASRCCIGSGFSREG